MENICHTLFLVILLNSLVSFRSFWVDALGFSVCTIMSPTNEQNFTSFCVICVAFISSSCLFALSRTSSTMLNGSDESRHFYLLPGIGGEGETFRRSPLTFMLAVDFS